MKSFLYERSEYDDFFSEIIKKRIGSPDNSFKCSVLYREGFFNHQPTTVKYHFLVGYLVEHRRTGSPHWVKASPIKVRQTQLTISGLEPGWRYQFRVTAENAIGYSEPSPLSEPLAIFVHRSAAIAPYFITELNDIVVLENEKVKC